MWKYNTYWVSIFIIVSSLHNQVQLKYVFCWEHNFEAESVHEFFQIGVLKT